MPLSRDLVSHWMLFVACAGIQAQAQAQAQAQELDVALGESIVFIQNSRLPPVDLETTIFKPEGSGPFPLVIVNHGKSLGNNRLQPRSRSLVVTRQFLQRGYAVVHPMRQGFSKSGGAVVGEGCNIAGTGEAQAEDIKAVVSWLGKQPWADTNRMLMVGQSHGGLTALAYAQDPHAGLKFVVNFAGGLRYSGGNCQTEKALKDAFARYGAKTKLESVWFYGENDSYFPPQVIGPAYQAYVAAGGKAQMVAFGPFGADAHGMLGSTAGLPIWWPTVLAKLEQHGLPTAVVHPQYAAAKALPVPEPTHWAPLQAVDRVPHVRDGGRKGYELFLTKPHPRAFAVAPSGSWAWANGGDDPLARALQSCQKHAAAPCRLYAVDDDVVWQP